MNYFIGIPGQLSDGVIRRFLTMPLSHVAEGSGHAGSGYNHGWIDGLSMCRINTLTPDVGEVVSKLVKRLPGFKVNQVMLNRLDAGTKLDKHRDGHSICYRFHLPIVTNGGVLWWDEITNREHHFFEGYWYGPVPYSGVLHSMVNRGREARYHLVVDLEPPL